MSDQKRESRINVEDLQSPEKELTKEEAEKVKGGFIPPVNPNPVGTSINPKGGSRTDSNNDGFAEIITGGGGSGPHRG